jgi:hypothetical protein
MHRRVVLKIFSTYVSANRFFEYNLVKRVC